MQGPHAPAPRPDGQLVWVHVEDGAAARALPSLSRRIREEIQDVAFLLTHPEDLPPPAPGPLCHPAPEERPQAAETFVARWRPDLMLHLGAISRPVLTAAATGAMPVVQAGPPPAPGRSLRARAARGQVPDLHAVLPPDRASARGFAALGAPLSRIAEPGRLRELTAAPEEVEDPLRAPLAEALSGRPVWFAACVPAGEIATVIGAHEEVLRRAHRAILILQTEADLPRLLRGLSTLEEGPREETRVLLAKPGARAALCHLLAPVSFLGGSFTIGAQAPPGPAASLGSAIAHGPRLGEQADALAPLSEAGAALLVPSPGELGRAVEQLLAPDRAASLAGAAWAAVTAGAETTDRLAALMLDALDGMPPPGGS